MATREMTTTEAAQYLTERGFTVHSKRDGTDKPPPSELIKRWCIRGKVKARKSGWVWLIEQEELDRFLENNKTL
jgi:hypothetical protein